MARDGKLIFAIADLIDKGDEAGIRNTFSSHPDQIDAYTPFAGGSWLHFAAEESSLDMVKLLLELGFSINQERKNFGGNSLEAAALGNRPDIAEYLLDHGANIDVRTSSSNPLFAAIVGESVSVAKLLLDRGIDATVRYTNDAMEDMDAVAFALVQRQPEIARMIALWNAKGDQELAETSLSHAKQVAELSLKSTKQKTRH